MKHRELGLIQGFLLCLWDSEAVRLQTSQWKEFSWCLAAAFAWRSPRSDFLGGLFGYETSWHLWLLTWLFAPLGLVGLYASKYGHD